MKKLQSVLNILAGTALLCALTACAGQENPSAAFEAGDLQTLVEAGAFSEELEPLDADVAFALYRLADYGLEPEDVTDCAAMRSAGATCEEGAVLVIGDESLVPKAEQALQDYVDSQIQANEDYRPNEIPKLSSALIAHRGTGVVLVVAADTDAARQALDLQ